MAITNIHPIKTTLKVAIDYICNADKTADEIYISTYLCSRENAYKEFELTKKQYDSKTKVLDHHLIQSFAPSEVSFEEAHQVGKELCDRILEGKYEYVLATHTDKDHIHNHIIFNSIDVEEGKVYHFYYGSYMRIRNQSDKLCKEHQLSVIDLETQKEINEIKRRKFVSWYDWDEDRKGNSYKSRLQFDIDRAIKKSINWEDFLNIMGGFGYEIKQGKHIAFKSEKQQRFTRAKTIGANYTEDSIKDRIQNKDKEVGSIIDVNNNQKIKSSKRYENWAIMNNLKIASETMLLVHEKGFASIHELEKELRKLLFSSIELRKEFKAKEFEQKRIKEIIKDLQICINKKAHYDGYKKNPNDKIYLMMNRKDIESYGKAYENVEIFLKQFPHLRNIVSKGLKRNGGKLLFRSLNEHSKKLQSERQSLAQEHDELRAKYEELEQLKNNIDKFVDKANESKKSIVKHIEKERTTNDEKGVIKIEKVMINQKNSNREL